jgi:flagellar protein FliS
MFGFNHGIKEYSRISLETGVIAASPLKLIVMLYDGAIKSCQLSVVHIKNKDISKKSISISNAIMIIQNGLLQSLNKESGGDIAKSLADLYLYMINRLYTANLKNQTDLVEEVIKLLLDLKASWELLEQDSLKKNINLPEQAFT